MDPLAGFLAAAVRIGTPLLLAATGELVTERAGVINLSIEGAMLAGALGSALGATAWGTSGGALGGLLAGTAVAGCFALVSVLGRADQVIAGTALTLASLGLTGDAH